MSVLTTMLGGEPEEVISALERDDVKLGESELKAALMNAFQKIARLEEFVNGLAQEKALRADLTRVERALNDLTLKVERLERQL